MKKIFQKSRDTTIKVWNSETGKLVQSFGGHTGCVTCVRFWPLKSFADCIENLKSNNEEEESLSELVNIGPTDIFDAEEDEEDENESTKSKQIFIFIGFDQNKKTNLF